jgi:hypothetical protein
MTRMAELEIVWRNPKPSQCRQRWEQINQDSGTAHYLVQEFVSISDMSFWTTTSSLEVGPGGRAAYCCPGGGAQKTRAQRVEMS